MVKSAKDDTDSAADELSPRKMLHNGIMETYFNLSPGHSRNSSGESGSSKGSGLIDEGSGLIDEGTEREEDSEKVASAGLSQLTVR